MIGIASTGPQLLAGRASEIQEINILYQEAKAVLLPGASKAIFRDTLQVSQTPSSIRWHALSIQRMPEQKELLFKTPLLGGTVTTKEWTKLVKNCPNAQGYRCCANGNLCKPENCAFLFLSKTLRGDSLEDE